VFHGNRWAVAFVTALGNNAGAGFDCLKTMVQPLKPVSGILFGYSAARQIESMLRAAVLTANGTVSTAAEYALRFIALVIEKEQFKHIDLIMRKIEERIDAHNGVLAVTVESAAPLDRSFEEQLKQCITERFGASAVKLNAALIPDLLGGYRLRIGGFFIDASLKGQMEQMKADLAGGIHYDQL
jgi:F-type H+-transporting ATPase subunit delta